MRAHGTPWSPTPILNVIHKVEGRSFGFEQRGGHEHVARAVRSRLEFLPQRLAVTFQRVHQRVPLAHQRHVPLDVGRELRPDLLELCSNLLEPLGYHRVGFRSGFRRRRKSNRRSQRRGPPRHALGKRVLVEVRDVGRVDDVLRDVFRAKQRVDVPECEPVKAGSRVRRLRCLEPFFRVAHSAPSLCPVAPLGRRDAVEEPRDDVGIVHVVAVAAGDAREPPEGLEGAAIRVEARVGQGEEGGGVSHDASGERADYELAHDGQVGDALGRRDIRRGSYDASGNRAEE
mmetsp:Transcript_8420/g.38294  ORF Transcript_8420/g.38294 Transcript_8420/m.38294 type:complete len:287 (-) Transcript_8420:396-1256(-)